MITVMGATGNTGKVAALRLLAQGEKVRVVARTADKLQPLVDRGAEAAVGDAADPAFLAKAFQGADVVYTLLPPHAQSQDLRAYQDKVGQTTVDSIRASHVPSVVFLSSLGAEHPSGTG